MKTRTIILFVTAAATCAIAVRLVSTHFGARERAAQPIAPRVNNIATKSAPAIVEPRVATPPTPATTTDNAPAPKVEAQPSTNASVPKKAPAKEPLKDPVARVALTLVGMDSDAEAYWLAAINDLTLPANEREDLIEDLNEEGLEDPKHPTIDDLPLIFNRIALIEAIGPDAADEVNADAFMEAYKDLLNLADLAMGGGQPVR